MSTLAEPMTMDAIKDALLASLALRVPRWEAETSGRDKVRLLEDHIMTMAYVRGDIEEGLHWLDYYIAQFAQQVQEISGYQAALPAKRQERITQADVLAAKRQINPMVFELGAEAKQLRESIKRQIARLRDDYESCSRTYTLLSGS